MPCPRPLVLAATVAAALLGAAAAGAIAAGRRGQRRVGLAVVEAHERARREALDAPSSAEARERVLVEVLLERPGPPSRDPLTIITDLIEMRLTDADRAAVEAVLEGTPADLWSQVGDSSRRRLTLNLAAHYGLTDVLERAGLAAAMPDESIHAMARGPVAAGGDTFVSDLIFDALDTAGLPVSEGATILDFGASSGRVLRMIAAARPDLRCLGCDPNTDAIRWASTNLPMAEFFHSPIAPPLDLPEHSIDLVCAISIWSHFAEAPALAWLAEMHRVLAPGGTLLITTHGFDCLAVQLRNGAISPGTASAAAAAMITSGHHFVDVFGEDGDWGVKDAGWGNAYLTLDWLQSRVGAMFSTCLLRPGALDRVQDVIVLQRR